MNHNPANNSSEDAEWFYSFNKEKKCPVSEAGLRALIQEGMVNGDTLVWRDGLQNWQAARTFPELAPGRVQAHSAPRAQSAPPPRPAANVPSRGTVSSSSSGAGNSPSSGATSSPSSEAGNGPSSGATSRASNEAVTVQKSSNPTGLIIGGILILLLGVGGGVGVTMFLGKNSGGGGGQNQPVTQTENTEQSVQPAQSPQTTEVAATPSDPAPVATPDTTPNSTSSEATSSLTPSTITQVAAFPPPASVTDVIAKMQTALSASQQTTQKDLAGIPEQDPDYDQHIGIINGTTENHSGSTIWKLKQGDRSQYLVVDPTYTKVCRYSGEGRLLEFGEANASDSNVVFPKMLYMYEYPAGRLHRLMVFTGPDAFYLYRQSGELHLYFSSTEIINGDGTKERNAPTIYPSK